MQILFFKDFINENAVKNLLTRSMTDLLSLFPKSYKSEIANIISANGIKYEDLAIQDSISRILNNHIEDILNDRPEKEIINSIVSNILKLGKYKIYETEIKKSVIRFINDIKKYIDKDVII